MHRNRWNSIDRKMRSYIDNSDLPCPIFLPDEARSAPEFPRYRLVILDAISRSTDVLTYIDVLRLHAKGIIACDFSGLVTTVAGPTRTSGS